MARIQISLPDHLPFSTEITLRITDINYGGHMGNDALLSLIHEARYQFFQSLGFESELNIADASIIMADSAIMYKAEAFQGETLVFEVGTDDHNKYGCDIVYRVTKKTSQQEVAVAKTGIVFFNYEQRAIQAPPSAFLSAVGHA